MQLIRSIIWIKPHRSIKPTDGVVVLRAGVRFDRYSSSPLSFAILDIGSDTLFVPFEHEVHHFWAYS